MKFGSNTVLVTGGASGIGLALAERFLATGDTVIACGRRADKLAEARAKHPALHTYTCDVGDEQARTALRDRVVAEHPKLNVLVNNAGIQRRVALANPAADPWSGTRDEIAINLEAPIHLVTLLLPHLATRPDAAVVNVTSGLAFAPLAGVPVYCATKAALRSFTQSLRVQLAQSNVPVEVIELIPPAVDTDLGGPGLHTFGAPLDTFADAVFAQLQAGATEAAYGMSEKALATSNNAFGEHFRAMNAPRR